MKTTAETIEDLCEQIKNEHIVILICDIDELILHDEQKFISLIE